MSGFDDFHPPEERKTMHGMADAIEREEAPPLPGDEPAARVPANVECEAALLGALMYDNRLLDDVAFLREGMFYEPFHRYLFTLIRTTVSKGREANPITLAPYVGTDAERDSDAKATRGYLAQLTGSGAAIVGARDFAAQVRDLYHLRRIREISYETIERTEVRDMDVDPSVIAGDLESAIAEELGDTAEKSTFTIAESMKKAVDEIERVAAGGEPRGFKIARHRDWNYIVGRMEPGDMILLGARPSMGKTGESMTVALGAAEAGYGTDFLSLEMDGEKSTRRAAATLIHDPDDPIPYEKLISGDLKQHHWRRIMGGMDLVAQMPLTISAPRSMDVEDLGPHIRKLKRYHMKKWGKPLRLVVLDYLGRLTTRKKLTGETEIASYISRMVKQAAKDEDVVIIALAQLNRALESRENKRPMLSDLRSSGSLEQDADIVVFLYRERYYLERTQPPRAQTEKWDKWRDDMEACANDMEIMSAKHREGALRKRVSKFFTEYQAVMDSDDPRLTSAPTFFDEAFPEMRGG